MEQEWQVKEYLFQNKATLQDWSVWDTIEPPGCPKQECHKGKELQVVEEWVLVARKGETLEFWSIEEVDEQADRWAFDIENL